MLGATDNNILGPADLLLKQAAVDAGSETRSTPPRWASSRLPDGEPGNQTVPDPLFRRRRSGANNVYRCGGCMMGCRFGAKNTLDLGYSVPGRKARRAHYPETRVIDVRPLYGMSDGGSGYEVSTFKSTTWIRRHPRKFTCRGVVFAASSLGTMELLFRLKETNSLPAISPQLGNHVRTNSESLIGARMPGYHEDLSKGIAIGSGIYIDEQLILKPFVIQVVRTRWAC